MIAKLLNAEMDIEKMVWKNVMMGTWLITMDAVKIAKYRVVMVAIVLANIKKTSVLQYVGMATIYQEKYVMMEIYIPEMVVLNIV